MDNNKLEISKEIPMQCKIEKLSHNLGTFSRLAGRRLFLENNVGAYLVLLSHKTHGKNI